MKLNFRTLFGFSLLLVVAYLCADVVAQKETPDSRTLSDRVSELETELKELRREVRDFHLSDKLTGHWVEASWVRNGKYVDESEAALGVGFGGPVEWRLATDVNSQRWLLCAEPKHTDFGSFTLDTSHSPTWINFHFKKGGRSHTIRGIVKHSYGEAQIAIPTERFEGNTFTDPARPTSFESTEENGYSVYSLKRKSFERTGVF